MLKKGEKVSIPGNFLVTCSVDQKMNTSKKMTSLEEVIETECNDVHFLAIFF